MIAFEIPTLNEGIDIDRRTMTISFNPYHEENVDTSLINNPTMTDTLFPGIKTYSVFKRKKNSQGSDGNPLIYAFKREKGWKFKSKMDKQLILEQFDKVIKKFSEMYPIGLTILVPSSNPLNAMLAERIRNVNPNCEIISDAIVKMTVDEVEDYLFFEGNEAIRDIRNNRWKNEVIDTIERAFERMREKKDGIFTYHLLPNNVRRYIYKSLKIADGHEYYMATRINGQHILVLDDTISQGKTLREVISLINEVFVPKSITILTLLSKLDQ